MFSIYQLKPAFQNLLRPIVKALYQYKVTANHVTLTAMLISVLLGIGLYIYYQNAVLDFWLLLFPLWMLLRMAFNAIDGMLAREFSQQSNLGAFLNELCDVISDTALYISLIIFPFIHGELLLLVCFLAILTEFTGVTATSIGKERCYAGPMGKSDRAFWFSALVIMMVSANFLNIASSWLSTLCNGILSLVGFLCIMTIYNRIKQSI